MDISIGGLEGIKTSYIGEPFEKVGVLFAGLFI
jgi:hypothetical protein